MMRLAPSTRSGAHRDVRDAARHAINHKSISILKYQLNGHIIGLVAIQP